MLAGPGTYFFEDAYLLGESAYPLNYHVITPFSQFESNIDREKQDSTQSLMQ